MGDKNVYKYTQRTNEEQPVNGLPSRYVRPRSVWSYKRLWVVIILFLFVGGTGGLVPAAKIPLFSTLVQAMGFSKEDAQEMSLLRALLKWHQKLQTGTVDRPEALTSAQIEENARLSAERSLMLSKYGEEQNKHNLDSSLISMRKLNAAQRRKGGQVDAIRGAAKRVNGNEKEDNAVKVKNIDTGVANTEANTDNKTEIFFGQDAGMIFRDERDGFNSTQILTKIKNPHIAGGASSSWLMRTIDRAMLSDANLGQIFKEFNSNGHAVDFDDIKNIGKDRPHRDLNYAWLTGKATYRTPNRMLKKTLAAAGFNGEDMPKQVFDSSLLGMGIGVDPNEVNQDAKSIRDRMAKDEKCQSKLLAQMDSRTKAYDNIKTSIKNLAASFPKTCAEVLQTGSASSLNGHLASISKQCKAINSSFGTLKRDCNVAFKSGECPVLSYDGNFEAFKKACEDEYKKCMAEMTTDAQGNQVPANDAKSCAKRRDEKKGETLQCGKYACTGDPIENDVRVRVTGYTSNADLDDSNGVRTDDSGNNILPDNTANTYMASQNANDIIETLKGNKDGKNTP